MKKNKLTMTALMTALLLMLNCTVCGMGDAHKRKRPDNAPEIRGESKIPKENRESRLKSRQKTIQSLQNNTVPSFQEANKTYILQKTVVSTPITQESARPKTLIRSNIVHSLEEPQKTSPVVYFAPPRAPLNQQGTDTGIQLMSQQSFKEPHIKFKTTIFNTIPRASLNPQLLHPVQHTTQQPVEQTKVIYLRTKNNIIKPRVLIPKKPPVHKPTEQPKKNIEPLRDDRPLQPNTPFETIYLRTKNNIIKPVVLIPKKLPVNQSSQGGSNVSTPLDDPFFESLFRNPQEESNNDKIPLSPIHYQPEYEALNLSGLESEETVNQIDYLNSSN